MPSNIIIYYHTQDLNSMFWENFNRFKDLVVGGDKWYSHIVNLKSLKYFNVIEVTSGELLFKFNFVIIK